jgi:hypothetical protein
MPQGGKVRQGTPGDCAGGGQEWVEPKLCHFRATAAKTPATTSTQIAQFALCGFLPSTAHD